MSEKIELPTAKLTVPEFIAWAMEQPRGRFELDDGQVVAMAPERGAHLRAKMAVFLALSKAVGAAGLSCDVLPDGATVRIDQATAYEPDASVTCGRRMGDDDTLAPDPVIVVEVTSPSNSRVDLTTKLTDYFRLPSVQHYLVVHLAKRVVIHHRRGEGGAVETRFVPSGALRLDPPGIVVQAEELFGR